MSAREIAEYEKVIDLWVSEGRVAWELVSIYIAVQAGLASVFALLYTQYPHDSKSLIFSLIFLAVVGVVSSFAWLFILYRARMRRENWFCLALRMERELYRRVFRDRDARFHIFAVELAVRIEGKALEYFRNEDEVRFRYQRWYERIGATRIAHLATLFIGGFWVLVLLVIIFHFLPNVL